MPPFGAAVEALGLQHRVHGGRARRGREAVAARPGGRECQCVGAAAFEARTMAGGERGRLVKEEQLGVTFAPYRAVPVLEGENATYPRTRGPAVPRQGALVVVNAPAAVAEEQPARGHGIELAERVDAVLQRHRLLTGCRGRIPR